MNIIFLDIVGVLCSSRSAIAFEGYPCPHPTKGILYPEKLDPVAVALVRKAQRITQAEIIISSTWRIGQFKEWPQTLGAVLGLNILDVTPKNSSGFRGAEIAQSTSKYSPDRYVIIDDDMDFYHWQRANLVHVDSANGFSAINYAEALAILIGEPV